MSNLPDKDSLQRQLAEARENLRLIEERVAEFVLGTDIPLQLVKEERGLRDRVAELEQQLAARSAALAGSGERQVPQPSDRSFEKIPEICVRIAPGSPTEYQISSKEVLPAKTINLDCHRSTDSFSLVVENVGNAPAVSVTIRIQHIPRASDPTDTRIGYDPTETWISSANVFIEEKFAGSFRAEEGRILKFSGYDKFKIYPGVPWVFHFDIGHPRPFFIITPPGEHLLDCTVWFEGWTGEPFVVNEKLAIRFVHSLDSCS